MGNSLLSNGLEVGRLDPELGPKYLVIPLTPARNELNILAALEGSNFDFDYQYHLDIDSQYRLGAHAPSKLCSKGRGSNYWPKTSAEWPQHLRGKEHCVPLHLKALIYLSH